MSEVLQAEYPVRVTNLDKYMWPHLRLTKADLIQYVIEVAPYMLAHYKKRPLTVIRFPNGVDGKSFYQKNAPKDTPDWVKTYPVWSTDRNDFLQFIIADTTASLIWLANQGVLEFHPWYSTIEAPNHPNVLTFDLDPTVPGFERVRKVAFTVKEVLDEYHFQGVPKTSGSSGLAIYVPLLPKYSFEETRIVMKTIAFEVRRRLPQHVTLERMVKNRGELVYFDYLQHARNKTLIGVYSPRANSKALVSTPLLWSELEAGAVPSDFPLTSINDRLRRMGDLFAPVLTGGVTLPNL